MEVFGIIIFVAILIIKQLAANEEDKGGAEIPDLPDTPVQADVLTGSMSGGGTMKSINRAPDELDAAREEKRTLSAQDLRRGFEELKMAPRAGTEDQGRAGAAQRGRAREQRKALGACAQKAGRPQRGPLHPYGQLRGAA